MDSLNEIYSYTLLLSLLSFALATAFSPGPNNLMLLSSGLTFGYKKSIPHILGVLIGFFIMVLAVGLGVGILFELFPWIYNVLKVVGLAYLLWMAWKIANASGSMSSEQYQKAKTFTFLQAVLFQWLNPKGWIMAITSTTSFTSSEGNFFLQVFIVSCVYFLVGLGSTNTWVLGGVFLQRLISNEKQVKIFNVTMAILIVLSVMPFLLI